MPAKIQIHRNREYLQGPWTQEAKKRGGGWTTSERAEVKCWRETPGGGHFKHTSWGYLVAWTQIHWCLDQHVIELETLQTYIYVGIN